MDNKEYYKYKEEINRNYLEDYISRTRGRTNTNIECIYKNIDSSHTKGTDNNPSMGYMRSIGKYHCMACNRMASIYDFIKIDYNVNSDLEVFNVLKELYPNIQPYNFSSPSDRRYNKQVEVKSNTSIEINKNFDFTNIINKLSNDVFSNSNNLACLVAYKYYKNRGLNDDTIKRFKLCGINDMNDLVINYPTLKSKSKKSNLYKFIIPLLDENGNCYNFLAEICNRKHIDEYNAKYKKPSSSSGITTLLFNEYYLKSNESQTIFIVEGVYDAMSIEQLGFKAIALIGIGGTRLLNLLKHYKPNVNIVMFLDNDITGMTHNENIIKNINGLNINSIKCVNGINLLNKYENISKCKDSNEMLLKDKEEFTLFLQESYNLFNKDIADTNYLKNAITHFKLGLEEFIRYLDNSK